MSWPSSTARPRIVSCRLTGRAGGGMGPSAATSLSVSVAGSSSHRWAATAVPAGSALVNSAWTTAGGSDPSGAANILRVGWARPAGRLERDLEGGEAGPNEAPGGCAGVLGGAACGRAVGAAERRAAAMAIVAAIAEATADADASTAEPVAADTRASSKPATAAVASTIRVVRSSGGVMIPSLTPKYRRREDPVL